MNINRTILNITVYFASFPDSVRFFYIHMIMNASYTQSIWYRLLPCSHEIYDDNGSKCWEIGHILIHESHSWTHFGGYHDRKRFWPSNWRKWPRVRVGRCSRPAINGCTHVPVFFPFKICKAKVGEVGGVCTCTFMPRHPLFCWDALGEWAQTSAFPKLTYARSSTGEDVLLYFDCRHTKHVDILCGNEWIDR